METAEQGQAQHQKALTQPWGVSQANNLWALSIRGHRVAAVSAGLVASSAQVVSLSQTYWKKQKLGQLEVCTLAGGHSVECQESLDSFPITLL